MGDSYIFQEGEREDAVYISRMSSQDKIRLCIESSSLMRVDLLECRG
jgi:hypothetical protein